MSEIFGSFGFVPGFTAKFKAEKSRSGASLDDEFCPYCFNDNPECKGCYPSQGSITEDDSLIRKVEADRFEEEIEEAIQNYFGKISTVRENGQIYLDSCSEANAGVCLARWSWIKDGFQRTPLTDSEQQQAQAILGRLLPKYHRQKR